MTDFANTTVGDQRVSLLDALQLVADERQRQDHKWGTVRGHLSHDRWLSILVEEAGESAEAMNDHDQGHLREEVVQVAAVCIAWLQHGDFS